MSAKKEPVKQEPLLSAVARKLGRAAGTVTNLTHELLNHGLGEDSSSPSATEKPVVRKAANIGVPAKSAPAGNAHHPKKSARRAAGTTKKAKRAGAKRVRSRG
ncbi:MAG: hypothetical protein WAK62_18150 [Terriglobales bacterium]